VRLIRMMCTGMVDPKFVIKALLQGADAVLISGCHPGDCHYINGNFKARRRVKLLKEILPKFGFDEKRLRLTWIGASEGHEFAHTIKEMVEEVKKLGPNPVRDKMVI
jgi:F420-non-reducing hydrogenase iron-sulfur subunit